MGRGPSPTRFAVLSQGTSSSCVSPQWSLGSHLHLLLGFWVAGGGVRGSGHTMSKHPTWEGRSLLQL